MAYRVNVIVDINNNQKGLTSAWLNFIAACESDIHKVNAALAEANGRNINKTPYIEFDTEKDAFMFLLRWS